MTQAHTVVPIGTIHSDRTDTALTDYWATSPARSSWTSDSVTTAWLGWTSSPMSTSLHRLWREDVVDWQGKHRMPLQSFTATPRPLDGIPPFVWHGSIRSPEIAEQAAYYGDGFFANHIFWPKEHFQRLIGLYRRRYEHYGHGAAEPTRPSSGSAGRSSCARTPRMRSASSAVLRPCPGLRWRAVARGVHRTDTADRWQSGRGDREDTYLP